MRVLVIEDDPDLNRQLTDAFKEAGYAVDTARDGEEGHFLGDTEPYDAVVLDIGLPVMDGYEATQHLKADPATRAIPVIALTAAAGLEDRKRALAAGADEYETKPIDFDRLLGKMDTLLSR